jgi:restriction endonuclease Mrr
MLMKNLREYRRIYKKIVDTLEVSPRTRAELLRSVVESLINDEKKLSDRRTNATQNLLRSACGAVVTEMTNRGMIYVDDLGLYHNAADKPVVIRLERCEEQILILLRERARTKKEIRDELVKFFKTDKTITTRDDNMLFSFIGQILKSLVREESIVYDGSLYSIAPLKIAEMKNKQELLSFKASFLSLIHSRGGEFFEHYFMNLLEKYLIRSGKIITESYVTGGAEDGGIDGICKTVDSLGFKETIMVQTKNRLESTSETDVRGFYGAVCARQGSRGIFVTTSTFHPLAEKLLDSIDNCVGVDGEKMFSMALDTAYGIKKKGNTLTIDYKIFS